MILRAGSQLNRLHAKLGIRLPPSLEIQVDAGAAALHQGLKGIVLKCLASGQRFFCRLNADAAIGMEAEPTNREKASNLLPKLARLPCAGDHFSEITNGACEIAT